MKEDRNEHEYPVTLDQKLVATLLGEADAGMAAEVEAALAADPQLRARRDELQAALGLLRTPEFAPALAPARRAELRDAAGRSGGAAVEGAAAPSAGTLHRFPVLRAAAALLVFGAAVALWQQPWSSDGSAARYDAAAPEATAGRPAAKDGDAGVVLDERMSSLGYVVDSLTDKVAPGSGATIEESAPAPSTRFEAPFDPSAWNADVGVGGGAGGAGGPYGGGGATGGLVAPGIAAAPPAGADVQFRLEANPQAPVIGLVQAAPPTEVGSNLGYVVQPSGELRGSGVPPAASPEPVERLRQLDEAKRGADQPADSGVRNRFDRRGEADQRDVTGALRGLGSGADGDLDEAAEDLDREAPRAVVIDGYGRGYYDTTVLEHLRPLCADCRRAEHRGRCRHHESPQDMFFRYYGDNAVVPTRDNALSTFAADVDTASYPLVRNYLVNGQLPPKSAVRTEEFVNYFGLGMTPPQEGDFAVHLDALPSLYSDGKLLLRAGIQARVVSREDRKPLNLVFVIDKSGSMAKENRIELVKRSLELLVDQLRDDDTVGIVTFDSDGHEVLAPTPGHQRWEIREAVRGLGTGGSTNAEAGLKLGYAMIERAQREGAVNRVVLASDGVANTGETDQARILADVKARAEARIDLTTIGVGMGNHNDVFLEQLADQGDGSCHYVDDFDEAKRVLVDGFTGVMQVVARDVKIQLEFDDEVVAGWRQLGYENRALTAEQFRDDSVDAGEVGAGHAVAALYELDLAQGAGADARLATLRLRWFPDGADQAVEEEHVLKLGAARTKWGLAEPRLRLSAVAAQYAEVLRRSYHARSDSYQDLLREAQTLARELADDRTVVELRDMVQRTESLARWQPLDDPLAQLVEEARQCRLQEARLARLEQDQRTAQLLQEVRDNNQRIEQRIQELLQQ